MTDLTPEAWARIRADYEHSDRLIHDICAEHGISSGTLRDRLRRWKWQRRRPPIAAMGPPPAPPPLPPLLSPPCLPLPDGEIAPPPPAAAESDAGPVAPRLQGAVARVLPAIEATVARLAAGPMPPREMEQAARALSSLTRTLRELNALLAQQPAPAAADDDDGMPENIDDFRNELARRIRAFVAERTGQGGDAEQRSPDGA